jgi:hypothetical protein
MKSITLTDPIKNKSFSWYNLGDDSILRSFEGFEYAQSINAFEDLPSELGTHYSTSKFSTRRLSWQGDLVGDSIFANRRLMIDVMGQNGLKLLKFTTYDDLQLQCEVVIDKLNFPYTHSINTFLVEAIAKDWRFYSQTEKTSTVAGSTTLTNSGNENTFPVITITGTDVDLDFVNNATGQTFSIVETLTSGQSIIIDSQAMTVEKEGVNIYGSFDGDFLMLDAGDNSISVTNNDSAVSITYSWRDAYRGI